MRPVAAVAAAVLALVSCGDSADSTSARSHPAGDADAVVTAALRAVLGDGSFRSRTTGQIRFVAQVEGIHEQSGGDSIDVVDIRMATASRSASGVSGGVAHVWSAATLSWVESSPVELSPRGASAGYLLGLTTVLSLDDTDTAESTSSDDLPVVATGWTEITGATDPGRRFQRTVSSKSFVGNGPGAADVPLKTREESAVSNEYVRLAARTSTVELDGHGRIARYTFESTFDGAPNYPACAPLTRAIGTTKQVVEFSDVGTDFTISVPTPEELVGRFPSLAEPPDPSSDAPNYLDRAFTNDAGERDLSGCPTP